MATLEELKRGAHVDGIDSSGPVSIVDVDWIGSAAVDVTYRTQQGQANSVLLYRENEPSLSVR